MEKKDWTQTVPRKPGRKQGSPPEEPMSDFYRERIKELSLSNEYSGIVRAMQNPADPAQQQQSPPWHGMAELANTLGLNIGGMAEQRGAELEKAVKARTDAEGEVHILRVQQLDAISQQMALTAQKIEEASKPKENGGGLNAAVGGVIESHVAGVLSNALGGNGNGNHQRDNSDPISVLTSQVQGVEALKQLLGVGQQPAVQSNNLSADLTKVILDHERQKLKDVQDSERGSGISRAIEGFVGWLQNNVDRDVIRDIIPKKNAQQPQQTAPPPPPPPSSPPSSEVMSCAKEGCKGSFTVASDQTSVECPECNTVYNLEEEGGSD